MSGRCEKHDNWHAHCQRCCAEDADALRAEVERLKAELAALNLSYEAAQAISAGRLAELNAERERHHATATELNKAVTWLDRCAWARSVIDLDAGPLEVQLADALAQVERLTMTDGLNLSEMTHSRNQYREEAEASRGRVERLTAALADVLARPMVEAEGTNPLVVTIHIAAERVEKWREALKETKP